jgi:ADP-heptose:LPS heptosyltransferase
LIRLVNTLRQGNYDLAVVPDRSPLMGIAVLLAGIPRRAGLDSAGRGFTYTVKAPIDPAVIRHEAEIYLDIARVLSLSTDDCWAKVPPTQSALDTVKVILKDAGADGRPLLIIHPGGGVNAGMTMTQKRWPADRFATLAVRIADSFGTQIAVIGSVSDNEVTSLVLSRLQHPALNLTNRLTLPQTGALASLAALYVGNDNGVAHLAAASGGKVLMIFGPSDPHRYAPFVPSSQARVAWRPVSLPTQGVSAGVPDRFDWERDGVNVDEVWTEAQKFL